MKKVIFAWLVIGIIVGAAGLGTMNYVLHETSTDAFCSSCHTNDVVPEWKQSVHYTNQFAVRAGCADCHLPEAFFPKMIRKAMAVKEVYGYFTGVIDTPEKFEAKRLEMAESEWNRMRANGAAECKSCHHMAEATPATSDEINGKKKVDLVTMHRGMLEAEGSMTCSNGCHAASPVKAQMIASHAAMQQAKLLGCKDCHIGEKNEASVPTIHKLALEQKNMICTDCHKGVAHKAPEAAKQ